MKTEILKLLRENGSYISGQALCEQFQVSRTAVWKVIKQLQQEGYKIEAVRNKGYHLVDAADVMTRAEIESSITGLWAGRCVEYREEVTSTNNLAKQLAEDGKGHGTLVVAEHQTGGRGRMGRSWESPAGTGIWMTLILFPRILPSEASMLTLVAALAVSEGIKDAAGLNTQIKWPNDIVCGGRKLCGILTEMSAEPEGIHYVVVGMGINTNMVSFPEEIGEVATSICAETGKTVHRSKVIAAVMSAFEGYYDRFIKRQDLSLLSDIYNSRLVSADRQVRVVSLKEEYTGTALGIDHRGQLLIQMEDGTVKTVVSGEVSVRGIYGYV